MKDVLVTLADRLPIVQISCWFTILVTLGIAEPVIAQPVPPHTPVSFSLAKLDPSPATANQPFSILVAIQNKSKLRVTLQASQNTDLSPFAQQLELAPLESRLLEMQGQYSAAGAHVVDVSLKLWSTVGLPTPHGAGRPGWWPVGSGSSSTIQVFSLQSPPPHPVHLDLSPNAVKQKSVDFSGVVQALAGSEVEKYAIPKTGGVWRSINGSPFHALPQSPPRAFAIAIDPRNSLHLAVGERADDDESVNVDTGQSGLWESPNEGDSWNYTYDPLLNAGSQRIEALTFSQTTSTLIVGTTSGIVRREGNNIAHAPIQGTFNSSQLSSRCTDITSFGAITAVAASKSRFWARSPTHIFWSDDDGKTWDCDRLKTMGVNVGSDSNMVANYNTTSNGANDNNSLGAFDDRAFVVFKQYVPNTDARAAQDPHCDPTNKAEYIPSDNNCEINNKSAMMAFYPGEASTSPGRWRAQYTNDGDGRGLNGRRFVNTYEFDPLKCPALVDRAIGKGRQIFYGSGQSVQQAIGLAPDGTITFDQALETQGGSNLQAKPINVHSDMWDFILPSDYCPPNRTVGYLATDGGVDRGTGGGSNVRLTAMNWQTVSAGLHVQTVQDLFVAEANAIPSDSNMGPLPVQNIAYPTQDNNGWWEGQAGPWVNIGVGGDANFVTGDTAVPLALIWRRLEGANDPQSGGLAALVGSDGVQHNFTLNVNQPFDGPTRIRAVQSLVNESSADPAMDLVMLVNLPLSDKTGKTIADPPGASGSGNRVALIRNPTFSKSPDGPATGFKGWTVEADSLPADTRRFWISGGHAAPQYWIYTGNGNMSCSQGLQKLLPARIIRGPLGTQRIPPRWDCLITNLLDVPNRNDDVSLHGPAFVDPYDSNIVLVASALGAGNAPGIKLSVDSGNTFCDLPILTNLITESGRYPLVGVYDPGSKFGDVGSTFHGYPLSVPSQIAFHREAPAELFVTSALTGLYFGKVGTPIVGGTGGCAGLKEPAWLDLSSTMPHARAYTTSAVLLNNSAVVSTEGYGIYGITNLSLANAASFFKPLSSVLSKAPVAQLSASNGKPVAWGRYTATVRQATTGVVMASFGPSRTDQAGNVTIQSTFPSGQYVVELQFAGDGQIDPSHAAYQLMVP